MLTINEEQADYWGKSASGAKWLTFEDQLDHLFTPVLNLLLDRSGLAEGMRVLDIGCGTGASALAAARRVGPSGHVLGADISEPFLARARQRATGAGMANVEFQYADAQTAQFERDVHDVLISRFGMMFFQDPTVAFANMARTLKPGGQISFVAWGPLSDNPWFKVPHVAATSRLGHPPKVDRNAPGPLAFHDRERVMGLMSQAGLSDIRSEAVPVQLHGPGTPDDSAALCTRVGPADRVITHFNGTPEDMRAIQTDVARTFEAYSTPQGVRIPALINLFQARRSD